MWNGLLNIRYRSLLRSETILTLKIKSWFIVYLDSGCSETHKLPSGRGFIKSFSWCENKFKLQKGDKHYLRHIDLSTFKPCGLSKGWSGLGSNFTFKLTKCRMTYRSVQDPKLLEQRNTEYSTEFGGYPVIGSENLRVKSVSSIKASYLNVRLLCKPKICQFNNGIRLWTGI